MAAVNPRATELLGAGVNGWRLAAIAAVLALVTAIYWPTLQSLDVAWRDTDRTTYTHGYLIVAISAWLLWRARARLAAGDEREFSLAQRWLLAGWLLATALLWQWAYRSGIQLAQQLLLPALYWLPVLALFGRTAARAAFLPLGFLYFAVPIWDVLNPLALAGSTQSVQLMLRLTGVPAHFRENTISVPAGEFEIEGGCSGLHYIIVALALAVLLGELRGDRLRARFFWMLIAGALAVLVNWIRVYIVIVAGHLTQMQHYLVRESHYEFGWALFALVIVALLVIDRRVPQREQEAAAPRHHGSAIRANWAWGATLVMLLASPLAMNAVVQHRLHSSAVAPWPAGTEQVSGCEPDAAHASAWQPRQIAADHETRARYVCAGTSIEKYAAWYREQLPRKKLGGYDNHLEGHASIIDETFESIGDRRLRALRLDQDGVQSLLWIWYRVGDREFTSATRAQISYGWQALRTLRSPVSAAMAIHARCEEDCASARAAMTNFVKEVP